MPTSTDQEVIRKAVELADGFSANPDWSILWFKDGGTDSKTFEEIQPWYRDLLAAQLVRQVDAKLRHDVVSYGSHTVVLYEGYSKSHKGDNRTMNTIRAIVDSGVLDTDREGTQ